MNQNISIGKWIVTFLLTLLVVPSILISLFVIPVELIALKPEIYSELLIEKDINNQMRPVIAEVVTNRILITDNTYPVLMDISNFETVIASYIPEEWTKGVLSELVANTLNYFNFQTPYATIEIDIMDFKKSVRENSGAIADDYVRSLETCPSEDNIQAGLATSLSDYPACKPAEEQRDNLSSLIAVYLEDRINRLPSSLNLVGLIPSGLVMGGNTFYWYSIARWIFRLMPFIALVLLISIALLLKNSKKMMRAWVGWIFLLLSGAMIIVSVVLLIGLDQFIGLLFNQSLALLIGGFGNVLLTIAQHIGNRVLIWVIAQAGGLFFVGLILMLASKYAKNTAVGGRETAKEAEKHEEFEESAEKQVVPQTLEEIEQAERENEPSD